MYSGGGGWGVCLNEKRLQKKSKDEMEVVHEDLDYRAMTSYDGRKML